MNRRPQRSTAGRREPPASDSPVAETHPAVVPWWRKWLLVAAVLLQLAWMGVLLSMAVRK